MNLNSFATQKPDRYSLSTYRCDETGRQSCLKMDLFSGNGVVKFQKLGVQEISSIAREAGALVKRLAVTPYKGSPTRGCPINAKWILI